jgi:AmmeMemoRadiSam system protein A/AmmeMemoRadiSam system protein B
VATLLGACGSCRERAAPESRGLEPNGSAQADPRPRKVRSPAEAGSFYPDDPDQLARTVRGYVDTATKVVTGRVRILLTPHAGLTFSGRIAGRAFKQLEADFSRVVILAANHSGDARFSGVAVDGETTHYRMPGFEVPVAPAVTELARLPGFVSEPKAHEKHMIEIELPFLRAVNPGPFSIVPLIVGRLDREGVRRLAAELAKLDEPRTLFVFSVDLSHYYPYERAVFLDKSCLDALVSTEADAIAACDTDGTQVLMTMNELAARLALTPRLVSYENSGDVSGDKARVVGYGALAYEDRFELGKLEGAELTALARRAIVARVERGQLMEAPPGLTQRWPRLGARRSVFVTLKKQGELRGCIGDLSPVEALADNVVHNAVNAATSDPRFSPVSSEELAAITLSVSVLDVPRPLAAMTAERLLAHLGEHKPGVVLVRGEHRSTFLPQVWEELPEPKSFLEHLCKKQGAAADCWSDPGTRYDTYAAQVFEEKREH